MKPLGIVVLGITCLQRGTLRVCPTEGTTSVLLDVPLPS